MVYEKINNWEKKKLLENVKMPIKRIQSKSGETELTVKKLKHGLQLTYLTREGGRWTPEDKLYIPEEMINPLVETIKSLAASETDK